MDNLGNSIANTCIKGETLAGILVFIRLKTNAPSGGFSVIHNNLSNRMAFVLAIDHSNFCPISFRR